MLYELLFWPWERACPAVMLKRHPSSSLFHCLTGNQHWRTICLYRCWKCVEDRERSVGTENLLKLWCSVFAHFLTYIFSSYREMVALRSSTWAVPRQIFSMKGKSTASRRGDPIRTWLPPLGLARGSWKISGLYSYWKLVDYFFLKQYKFSNILGVGEMTDWVGTEAWSEPMMGEGRWRLLSLAFAEALLVVAPALYTKQSGQALTHRGAV